VALLMDYADVFILPTLSDTGSPRDPRGDGARAPRTGDARRGIPFQVPESCGVLVDPGSACALRDGFRSLVQDMDRLAAMGRAARTRVARDCSWDVSARTALATYRELVGTVVTTAGWFPRKP